MNHIQRIIKDEVVDPRLSQGALSTYGYIMDYNDKTNTATVNIFDKHIGKYILYKDVPMMDRTDGVIGSRPKDRTSVWIDFAGGNKNIPRISGLRVDEYTREFEASDNGQGVPDILGLFNAFGSMVSGIIGGWIK